MPIKFCIPSSGTEVFSRISFSISSGHLMALLETFVYFPLTMRIYFQLCHPLTSVVRCILQISIFLSPYVTLLYDGARMQYSCWCFASVSIPLQYYPRVPANACLLRLSEPNTQIKEYDVEEALDCTGMKRAQKVVIKWSLVPFSWHDIFRARSKSGAPCSNLRSFGSKSTLLKKVLVRLLRLFGVPRSDSAPGNCAPLALPRYAPGCQPVFTKKARPCPKKSQKSQIAVLRHTRYTHKTCINKQKSLSETQI